MTISCSWHSSCFDDSQNEINTMYRIETERQPGLIFRLIFICLSAVCQYSVTTAALAVPESTGNGSAYIDSVYSWGAWALEIEPVAGPRAPVNRAINNRSTQLQFRPNDNAAYTSKSIPIPAVTIMSPPPPPPVRPAAPVRPPAPAVPAMPVTRPDGSGPVISGAAPTAPNRRR